MTRLHKFSLKRFFSVAVWLTIFCVVTPTTFASNINQKEIYSSLTTEANRSVQINIPTDTIPVRKLERQPNKANPVLPANTSLSDTTRNPDSLRVTTDSFSLKLSKDTLDAPVHYEAEDSAVVLADEKKIILYGKTKTVYKDVTLNAPQLELNQTTNIVTAYSEKDSAGNVITRARFEQADNKFESALIQYNFKSQKGLTTNTFTRQDEMFVIGETIKKVNASTFFVSRGQFTTCNLDEPHFAFRANKMKVINNKVAVTGPVHPEFEGVPVPIYLPFGYYPLTRGRHSGLLPPQFAVNEQFGLGLEGLGYYHVLNDHVDVTLRGNLYSYGGWSTNLTSSYFTRYRFRGGINLGLINNKINFKGDPDYRKTKAFNISWNHSLDQKSKPGVTFTANVNAGSTKYNKLVANDPALNFTNKLYSSISYSKNWIGKPYNLTLSANHDQDNNSRLINLRLPDGTFNVATIYPFQRKEAAGAERWYEKLGIGYTGAFRNQITFYDSLFSLKKIRDTLQWGATHSLPINLSLPPMGPFIVSPSISYNEQWIMRKADLDWNPVTKKVDTSFSKGFYTARQVSTGLSFNTALYGTVNFKSGSAVRHVVRPNFGFSYSPNMARNYYETIQIDTTAKNFLTYSQFSGNLFSSGFSNQRFGGLSFGVDNTLELKKRDKKDTAATAFKKIRLIDGFGFSSGYNFLEDSFQLNNFSLSLRSTLFDKLNLSASANLDPYQVDERGRRVNRLSIKENLLTPGRITYVGVSMSTQFRSKPRKGTKAATQEPVSPARNSQVGGDPMMMADQQRLQEYMRRNPAEFVDFNIPWDINLDFSFNLSRQLKPDLSGFENIIGSTVSFRNSFSLTPKWNFSTNGYLDLKTRQLQTFTMSLNRDLHCWQLSANVTPVGQYSYFNISISPKSSILQDLKVNRTRVFTDF